MLCAAATPLTVPCCWIASGLQEYGAALKVVKIEADANKATLEKYKVRLIAFAQMTSTRVRQLAFAFPGSCWARGVLCDGVAKLVRNHMAGELRHAAAL